MVKSVYSAVWTDSLYKADYISSLKGYTTLFDVNNSLRNVVKEIYIHLVYLH